MDMTVPREDQEGDRQTRVRRCGQIIPLLVRAQSGEGKRGWGGEVSHRIAGDDQNIGDRLLIWRLFYVREMFDAFHDYPRVCFSSDSE